MKAVVNINNSFKIYNSYSRYTIAFIYRKEIAMIIKIVGFIYGRHSKLYRHLIDAEEKKRR